jgi:hypothetical protein
LLLAAPAVAEASEFALHGIEFSGRADCCCRHLDDSDDELGSKRTILPSCCCEVLPVHESTARERLAVVCAAPVTAVVAVVAVTDPSRLPWQATSCRSAVVARGPPTSGPLLAQRTSLVL